jgi:MFS family permease
MTTETQARHVRTFYTLIITQVISLIGSRMTGLALSIYIFGQTGDVTPLALVALFQFLPQVIGAGVAGVLADRYDRRLVMVLSDAGQAVGTLFLLISFASATFQLWHLYVVTFVQSLFGMLQSPAFVASVTLMIPDSQRNRANAIMQLTNPAAGVIAPALAGVLYALVGLTGVITIDLITFLIAVGVVLLVKIPRPTESAEGRALKGSVLREALGGFGYLWKMRPIFWVTLHISLVNFLLSGAMILMTPYLLGRTGSEATLGALLGVLNAGALVGGIVMGVWGGTQERIHTILLGIAATGFFMALVGISRVPLALGIVMFLLMIPIPMINASAMGIIQAKVPPDLQGRVFAVLGQLATVLIPLSYLIVGPLSDTVIEPAVGQPGWETVAPLVGDSAGAGYGLIMLVAGIVLVITTLLVYMIPSIRHLERTVPDYVPDAPSGVPAVSSTS